MDRAIVLSNSEALQLRGGGGGGEVVLRGSQ